MRTMLANTKENAVSTIYLPCSPNLYALSCHFRLEAKWKSDLVG